MKISHRPDLLLLTGLACVLILSVLLFSISKIENRNLLEEKQAETKTTELPKVLSLNTYPIKTTCIDYTDWEQMVKFVTNNEDTARVRKEIEIPLPGYYVDYALIIDKHLKEIYSTSPTQSQVIKKLNIDSFILEKEIYRDYFRHFFMKEKNIFLEVYAAPIHPTSAIDRNIKPSGFLLLCTELESTNFRMLHEIDGGIKLTLSDKNNIIQEDISANSKQGSVSGVYNCTSVGKSC